MPASIPSKSPLKELLKGHRFVQRDRRLTQAMKALRARDETAPRSLLDAISSAQSRLDERLAEIDRATRPRDS